MFVSSSSSVLPGGKLVITQKREREDDTLEGKESGRGLLASSSRRTFPSQTPLQRVPLLFFFSCVLAAVAF